MTLRTLNDAPVFLGGVPVSSGALAAIALPTVALSAVQCGIVFLREGAA